MGSPDIPSLPVISSIPLPEISVVRLSSVVQMAGGPHVSRLPLPGLPGTAELPQVLLPGLPRVPGIPGVHLRRRRWLVGSPRPPEGVWGLVSGVGRGLVRRWRRVGRGPEATGGVLPHQSSPREGTGPWGLGGVLLVVTWHGRQRLLGGLWQGLAVGRHGRWWV